MAWEKRERGGLYYYRSIRQGRRVRKVYLGSGALGAMAAEGDALRRTDRERVRKESAAAVAALLEPFEAASRDVEPFDRLLSERVAKELRAAGYHRHRGEWRRRRRA